MKKLLFPIISAAAIAFSGCASVQPSNPQNAAAPVPVYQPVYSTGYVTIHTVPEGAMVLVNTFSGGLYLKYLAQGYSPLTVPVQLIDGGTSETLVIEATPTGPGQLSQRWNIPINRTPGDYYWSMYNTGFGANM